MSYKKVELLPHRKKDRNGAAVKDSDRYRFGHSRLVKICDYRDGDVLFDADRNTAHYLSRDLLRQLRDRQDGVLISELRQTVSRYGVDARSFLEMVESGIFSPLSAIPSHSRRHESIPSILFSPSAGCNLACSYCYSEAVIKHEYVQKDCYEIAIRETIGNVRNQKDNFLKAILGEPQKIRLGIIGGGEPTLNPSLFIDIMKTFRRQCEDAGMEPIYSVISNGTFGENVLRALIENNVDIMISIDGYAEVQNTQRPFHDGSKTYHIVIDNIRKLVAGGCLVTIRSTITRGSLPHMMDIVDMARKESVPVIHMEPLGLSGRALSSGSIPPDPADYCHGFSDAFIDALKSGIEIKSNQFQLVMPYRRTFCGACGTNRIITTEGYVSSCTEVTDAHSSLADTFIIGKVGMESRRLELWQDRIDALGSRTLENMLDCAQCFLRFNCAGNCPAKSLRTHGDMYRPVEEWCVASRALSIDVLSKLLAE
jgi:uncharacterized protein